MYPHTLGSTSAALLSGPVLFLDERLVIGRNRASETPLHGPNSSPRNSVL